RDGHVTGVQTCALPIFVPGTVPSAVPRLRRRAEIRLAQLVALPQLVTRARVDDRPLLHHERGVGMAQHADVLLHDDHGDTVVVRSEERRVGKGWRWEWL